MSNLTAKEIMDISRKVDLIQNAVLEKSIAAMIINDSLVMDTFIDDKIKMEEKLIQFRKTHFKDCNSKNVSNNEKYEEYNKLTDEYIKKFYPKDNDKIFSAKMKALLKKNNETTDIDERIKNTVEMFKIISENKEFSLKNIEFYYTTLNKIEEFKQSKLEGEKKIQENKNYLSYVKKILEF